MECSTKMVQEQFNLKEERENLKSFHLSDIQGTNITPIINELRQDCVVKIAGVEQHDADHLIRQVSSKMGLLENLELQTSFASILGHRKNRGKHYMTVNSRKAYEYIPAHSEGTSKTNIQLASMYCQEKYI